jgi:hypothetical protein
MADAAVETLRGHKKITYCSRHHVPFRPSQRCPRSTPGDSHLHQLCKRRILHHGTKLRQGRGLGWRVTDVKSSTADRMTSNGPMS